MGEHAQPPCSACSLTRPRHAFPADSASLTGKENSDCPLDSFFSLCSACRPTVQHRALRVSDRVLVDPLSSRPTADIAPDCIDFDVGVRGITRAVDVDRHERPVPSRQRAEAFCFHGFPYLRVCSCRAEFDEVLDSESSECAAPVT
jgi:hypothetical protein